MSMTVVHDTAMLDLAIIIGAGYLIVDVVWELTRGWRP